MNAKRFCFHFAIASVFALMFVLALDVSADGMVMQSTVNVADPMSREGSGTSWVPDSSPIYARMDMFGDSMLMLHGAIFPRYVNANTDRGDDRIDAPNWFMARLDFAG